MARNNSRRSVQNRQFWESADNNVDSFVHYYDKLIEIALARFEYKGLPDTVDERFMELALMNNGCALFFEDDVIGKIITRTTLAGPLNIYDIPIRRNAFANNGYRAYLDDTNSVIIYNNYLHKPSRRALRYYAKRLATYDNVIDINVNAQKTPILITSAENTQLTMKQLYMKYEGNTPVIFGTKGLSPEAFTVLKTDAPYVADKIYQLKTDVWNEALTHLGIANVSITKKERMITDEVNRSQGGTIASKESPLQTRIKCFDAVNRMFGTNIEVSFREDLDTTMPENPYTTVRNFQYETGGNDNE